MSQQELLSSLVEFLNGSGIEYMLTGSIVSSIQGEPRMSHDISDQYLRHWISQRGIAEEWKSMLALAAPT